MSVFDLTGRGLDRRSLPCWVLRDEHGTDREEHFDSPQQALQAAPPRTPALAAVPRMGLRCWTATTACRVPFDGDDGVLHWDLPNPAGLVVALLQSGWRPAADGRWACPYRDCPTCTPLPLLPHRWVRQWRRPAVRSFRWRRGGLQLRPVRQEQLLCGLSLTVAGRSITASWADSVPVVDNAPGPYPGTVAPLKVRTGGYVLVRTEDSYTTVDGPMPKSEALAAFERITRSWPHQRRLRVMTEAEYRRMRLADPTPAARAGLPIPTAPVAAAPGEGSAR